MFELPYPRQMCKDLDNIPELSSLSPKERVEAVRKVIAIYSNWSKQTLNDEATNSGYIKGVF